MMLVVLLVIMTVVGMLLHGLRRLSALDVLACFNGNIPFCRDEPPCRYSKEHLFVFCDRSSMDRPASIHCVKICLAQARQCRTHSTCFFIGLYLVRQEEIIDVMCVSPADATKRGL